MRHKDINLYWWKGKSVNIGDEINRYVVEYVSGRQVRHSGIGTAELLAIGSVLQFPQRSNVILARKAPYLVWGSGTLSAEGIIHQEKFSLGAIRGPLSLSLFNNITSAQFGDPGILASAIWQPRTKKSHAWGVIPHHSQLGRPWVQRVLENTPYSVLIDVTNPDILESMHTLSSCERIASSSLHGLIFADSYKIPNIWLWDGAPHGGGTWKYFDYFSGIGRHLSDYIPCGNVTNLNDINMDKVCCSHFGRIDMIAKRLIQSFPL